MTSENTNALAFERVPDIASPVIVTTEQHTSRDRKRNGCDTAQNVVVGEGVQLAISTNVEKPARGVIGPSGEGITVGEESDDARQEQNTPRSDEGDLRDSIDV